MKLILADDDGTVLDSLDVSRSDWLLAQSSGLGAFALLSELQSGGAEPTQADKQRRGREVSEMPDLNYDTDGGAKHRYYEEN